MMYSFDGVSGINIQQIKNGYERPDEKHIIVSPDIVKETLNSDETGI